MKKILFVVFLLSMMGITASAEDIVIQGESFKDSYANEKVQVLPSGNSNPVMVISQWKNPNKSYYVEYEFEAPAMGGYELSAVVSEIDSPYTSNFSYSVNGGEEIYSGDVFKKVAKAPTSFSADSTYLYTFGVVELKKGTNTIRFIIDESRETSTNWAVFYLDYFAFTKKEFGISSLIPTKPNYVFESGDNVILKAQFSDCSSEDMTYTAVLEDYFHNRICGKRFVLSKSSMSYSLNFGTLSPGWYNVLIYEGEKKVYNTAFSVTHKVSERKENIHFAMDFAGFSLTSGKTEVKNLCRAVRLAGIDTVRERYFWSTSDTLNKYRNETISAEGIDVINVFHDAPTALLSGGYMPDDLFEVYNFQKNYAQKFTGLVDYMEIWNEEDTVFASETADRYSSFLKAAAIGITDGSSVMGKVHGGFANSPADTEYMDLCMMNDFMEYSDMYNYHAYAYGGKEFVKTPSLDKVELTENRDILTAYGYDNRRTWVTEGGISILNEVELSRRQQARASVINNVQSMANGNDKHFLFVLPQYYESGSEYGIFCKDKSPSPAYTALENFTYHMGEGKYKGIFRDLTDNTYGYLFNNGDQDIGVFWTDSGESFAQVSTSNSVVKVDLMGNETILKPVNGIVGVKVGMDPIYLIFNSSVEQEYYLADDKKKVEFENAYISDNKRIVLQQFFENENYVDEKNKGYLIQNGDNNCTLKVYNFSENPQVVTIRAKISDYFNIDKDYQKLTIPPMSSANVNFTISIKDNVTSNKSGFLQFYGTVGGNEISRSTSVIRYDKNGGYPLKGSFENAKYAWKWHTRASTSSGSVTATGTANAGEVKFDVRLDGNGWSYPTFDVEDTSLLHGSTGLKFSVGADEDVSQATMYCFVYMKDGRKYFQGSINGKKIYKGYTDYYFPWDELVIQYMPAGVTKTDLLIDDIKYVAIGVNLSGTKTASYYLKDIGWYIKEDTDDDIQRERVEIDGTADGGAYYKGMIPTASARLPQKDNITSVRVYLSGHEYYNYDLTGNLVNINLNTLDTGVYTLLVTAENDFGYIYRDSIDFIVQ